MRVVWLILVVLAAGCGGSDFDGPGDHAPGDFDPVIGAPCFSDRDCLAVCATGGRFPGGFCTLPCSTDADCTVDTVCVTDYGGVCLFPCGSDPQCFDLGPGYECRTRENFFEQDRPVCIGD